jgi:hypothetical protein
VSYFQLAVFHIPDYYQEFSRLQAFSTAEFRVIEWRGVELIRAGLPSWADREITMLAVKESFLWRLILRYHDLNLSFQIPMQIFIPIYQETQKK